MATIEPIGYQQAVLDLTSPTNKTIISAYHGSGITTLGLLAARLWAVHGESVGFVSSTIRTWQDYDGHVFLEHAKRKRTFKLNRKAFGFDGEFDGGGKIELMTPDSLWRIRNSYYDYIVVDDGDLIAKEHGQFLEEHIGQTGMMVLGCVFNSGDWFRSCWTTALEKGWDSMAFHFIPEWEHA